MTPRVYIKRAPPIPRTGIYELYWTFASRRHAIFEARLAGAPQPWTDDPILQTYKFCNVFRAADRVSQYMIGSVACASSSISAEDRLFQIVAFRTFSNIETWRGLLERIGPPCVAHLRDGSFEHALDDIKADNGGLYTGAFILCANKAFGFDEKHRNHVALFKHMFVEHSVAFRLLQAPTLCDVVALLQSFPLMGPFMAYQIAIDLNYSDLLDFSENDFTQAGPGALRGIKKAFVDTGDYDPADVILWMTEQQNEEFELLDLKFNGLFGRPLHAIDCQGLFCELDKYCREAAPELASARSRIKAKYVPSREAFELTFPDKWNLRPTTSAVKATAPRQGRLSLAVDEARIRRSAQAKSQRRPTHDLQDQMGDLFLRS